MKVQINIFDERRRPDLYATQRTAVRDTKGVHKEITRTIPRDRHTGDLHHESITIKTWRKRKDACEEDEHHSVTLEGDEVQRLIDFVEAARAMAMPTRPGNHIVDIESSQALQGSTMMRRLQAFTGPERTEVLALMLRQAFAKPELLRALLERVDEDREFLEKAGAAINLFLFRRALAELEHLIDTSDRESEFQSLLSRHPWMFGSEYSALENRRRWTRDEVHDFMVRRTTDGFIELVEIKTPGPSLFVQDRSHGTLYPSADLSKVIAQVENYLEKLDRRRDTILADDKVDANKVRAKIVIGRDGDEAQRQALRRCNGHLHRIEVLTFDDLHRIARRVLHYLEEPLPQKGSAEPHPAHG